MAFIHALIFYATKCIIDSPYQRTTDIESNLATVTSKVISDYFDCEY